MRKFGELSLILVALVATLCGYTQNNIVSPSSGLVGGDGQSGLEVRKNIDTNWMEIREDLRDKFLESYGEFVDHVMNMGMRYDEDSDLVTLLLPVSHKTTGEIVTAFARIVLREAGTSVSIQNFYYEAPEEGDTDGTYYGSYFNDHDVLAQVSFYDREGKTDIYLVNDTVKAGEQRTLVARN